MVRTQIYLSESLHDALGRAARRRGVSMAALIREAAEQVTAGAKDAADPLEGLVGLEDRGPTDMAERHDAYLVGRRGRPKSRR